MSRDVVVNWRVAGPHPTTEQINLVLTDYVRGLAETVYWQKDRWIVDLPGTPSFAYQRVGPATTNQRAAWLEMAHETTGGPRFRWIEVWPDKDCCYVMTRDMDEITNAIADCFAKLLARAFDGAIAPP